MQGLKHASYGSEAIIDQMRMLVEDVNGDVSPAGKRAYSVLGRVRSLLANALEGSAISSPTTWTFKHGGGEEPLYIKNVEDWGKVAEQLAQLFIHHEAKERWLKSRPRASVQGNTNDITIVGGSEDDDGRYIGNLSRKSSWPKCRLETWKATSDLIGWNLPENRRSAIANWVDSVLAFADNAVAQNDYQALFELSAKLQAMEWGSDQIHPDTAKWFAGYEKARQQGLEDLAPEGRGDQEEQKKQGGRRVPMFKQANLYIRQRGFQITKQQFDRLPLNAVSTLAKHFGMSGQVLDSEDRGQVWDGIQTQKGKSVPAPVELPSDLGAESVEQMPADVEVEEPVSQENPDLAAEVARLREETEARRELARLKEENQKLRFNEKRREKRRTKKAGYSKGRFPWADRPDEFAAHAHGIFSGHVEWTEGGKTSVQNFQSPTEAVEYGLGLKKESRHVKVALKWTDEQAKTYAAVLFESWNGRPFNKTSEQHGEIGGIPKRASYWDDDSDPKPVQPKSDKVKPENIADELARLQGLGKKQKVGPAHTSKPPETVFGPVTVTKEVLQQANPEAVRKEALESADSAARRLKQDYPGEKIIWLMTHVPGWYEGSVPKVVPAGRPDGGHFAQAPHADLTSEEQYRELWLEPFKARLVELGFEVEERSGKKTDKWAGAEVPLSKRAGGRRW